MTSRNPSRLRRAALAAALVAGGLFAVGTAQAAPLAAPPAGIAAESGLTSVHWRGRHWGHHHGHRHGWGRHWGWRHHHHGWGHRHRHHHHWRHRHFY